MNSVTVNGPPHSVSAPESKSATAETPPPEIRDAASQLEGYFLSLLLKEMRKTVGGDGMFAGDKSDVQGGLFDMFLGRHLAESGGVGVAQFVERYAEIDQLQQASIDGSQQLDQVLSSGAR